MKETYNKRLILVILSSLFWTYIISAQESDKYQYTLHINSDNDAFSPARNFDRYYTYGVGIELNFRSERLLGLERILKNKTDYFFNAGIRSEGYTPTRFEFNTADPDEIILNMDRPFAGLLYGNFGATYLFKNWFIKSELILGVMGPSAQSQEIQDWIHDNITDDPRIDGWSLQMPNQLILNFNTKAVYTHNVNNWFDIFGMAEARIGNLYIDTTPTLGFRLGKFSNFSSSAVFNNELLGKKEQFEIFMRSSFSITLAAYNGTAQGNMFCDNFVYAVDDLNHFYPSMSHGIFISYKRFVISWDNRFTFGEVTKGIDHIYARIGLSYRFN